MAAMFSGINVNQIAMVFAKQYYGIIHDNPQVGYQFYTDASTMIRVDGSKEKFVASIMNIHNLLLDLNFETIEIKNVNGLSSWSGGVLVMVSGFVQMKDCGGRRKFSQTFFLAPQEKGYFVLNDIFHLLDEETTVHPPATMMGHNNYDNSCNVANHHMQNPGFGYTGGEGIQTRDYVSPVNVVEEELQAREYVAPLHAEETNTVDKYSIPEPQYVMPEPHYSLSEHQYNIAEPQQISEAGKLDEIPAEEPIASFPNTATLVRDPPAPAEPLGERPKQSYASILRHAKGQASNSMPRAAPVSKINPVVSDTQVATSQQSYPAIPVQPENSSWEAVEEVTTVEDEGEVKSVYVGNLSSSVSASDLENEFKNFGRIRENGVTVRSRKDSGGFYAFVEFEDAASVQTALQASPILVNGRQIYVEERRPNSGISRMGGGRRGRGRGGYQQSDVPRGRFGGRGYFRSSGSDFHDREYNGGRSRGNGFPQRVPRQERGILGNHAMRNGQYPSESAD